MSMKFLGVLIYLEWSMVTGDSLDKPKKFKGFNEGQFLELRIGSPRFKERKFRDMKYL